MNKNDKNNKLLDQDIADRLTHEQQDQPKLDHSKQKGRWLQSGIALLLAIVVLIGIVYPLFHLN